MTTPFPLLLALTRRLLPSAFCLLPPLLAAALPARAQTDAERLRFTYGTGTGAEILLTNSGFGAGVYAMRYGGAGRSAVIEVQLSGLRDERETKFFGVGGGTAIQAKANFLVVLPLRVGVSQRLLAGRVEDNARPFVLVTAGPLVGWSYPYFGDCDGDSDFDRSVDCDGDGVVAEGEGERVLGFFAAQGRGRPVGGLSAFVAVGAHVGFSRSRAQGLRVGYRIDYLPTGVRLLEASVKPRQRVFATPVLSFTFGRLARGER